MKKIIVLIFLFLMLTGCVRITDAEIPELINKVQNSKSKLSNESRKGYKYYLPTGLYINEVDNFNEVIASGDTKYYMFVDIVSYYNKVKKEYKENKLSYFSKDISYNDINGYLEINQQNNKYLIEIMYNYAKIELIVDLEDIKESVTNALIILSTIKYNDDIIENMMGKDILNFNEEDLNIFKTSGEESNFLEYIQEYDSYETEEVPDTDLIN